MGTYISRVVSAENVYVCLCVLYLRVVTRTVRLCLESLLLGVDSNTRYKTYKTSTS